MDIVIKNIESLSKYTGGQKEMPKKVVVDFDMLTTNEFTTIFFNACEEYKEPRIKSTDECMTCKYWPLNYVRNFIKYFWQK